MTGRIKGVVVAALIAVTPACAWLPTIFRPIPPSVAVKEVAVDARETATVVAIAGDRPFEYLVYRLKHPDRIAIEVDRGIVEGAPDAPAPAGLVTDVVVRPFPEAHAVRVEIQTDGMADYDIDQIGPDLSLNLTRRLTPEDTRLQSRLAAAKAELARLEAATAATAAPDPATVLADRIDRWRSAWERKDIETYASFYADDFVSGRYDRAGWVERKRRIFSDAGEVTIAIMDLHATVEDRSAVVTFIQDYRSNANVDRGKKSLRLIMGNDGLWRIVAEIWSSLP